MKHDLGDRIPLARAPRAEPKPANVGDRLAPDPGLQFHQLMNALRRRRGLIIAVSAAGTLLAAVAAVAIPPSYTATAQIVVKSARAVPGLAAVEGPDDPAVDTQVAMLTS